MQPEVETSHGKLRGQARGGHLAFLGVRYASPPVGALRFRAPEPPAPWSGVRDALAFGPCAPQDPLAAPGFKAEGPESEDCLYLNVYTPAADSARRPVLFWIHGGGFSHGAGSQPSYDGGPLAERGDVVVVTINYRLGALGYLFLGAHGGPRWGAANNAGQLDQIAALRWVRDNIAAFGGDPQRVMVFGESAGGEAVCTLLASLLAAGLFAAAAIESGPCGTKSLADAESYGDTVVSAVGCAGAADVPACLRAASPDSFMSTLPPSMIGQLPDWRQRAIRTQAGRPPGPPSYRLAAPIPSSPWTPHPSS